MVSNSLAWFNTTVIIVTRGLFFKLFLYKFFTPLPPSSIIGLLSNELFALKKVLFVKPGFYIDFMGNG